MQRAKSVFVALYLVLHRFLLTHKFVSVKTNCSRTRQQINLFLQPDMACLPSDFFLSFLSTSLVATGAIGATPSNLTDFPLIATPTVKIWEGYSWIFNHRVVLCVGLQTSPCGAKYSLYQTVKYVFPPMWMDHFTLFRETSSMPVCFKSYTSF